MTKTISVLVLLLSLTTNVNAQFNLSFGAEGALMQKGFGNVAIYGVGGTLGAEIGLSNKSGLTLKTGYLHLNPTDNYAKAHLIPYLFGLKMYFNYKDNGAYFHPNVGFHKFSQTRKAYARYNSIAPEVTTSTTDISYGLGIGYITTKNIDIEVRYNLLTGITGSNSYLALSVAYVLFKRY